MVSSAAVPQPEEGRWNGHAVPVAVVEVAQLTPARAVAIATTRPLGTPSCPPTSMIVRVAELGVVRLGRRFPVRARHRPAAGARAAEDIGGLARPTEEQRHHRHGRDQPEDR
jgi:hypothetical protein